MAEEAAFEKKAKSEYYIEVVHPALVTKLLFTYPLPTTLNNWIERACTLDVQWRFDHSLKQCTNRTVCNFRPSLPRATPLAKDPYAMDVDALSATQKQDYLQEHRCFKCGKVRHQARDCRSRASNQNEKVEKTEESNMDSVVERIAAMSKEDREKVLTHFL